MESYTSLYIFVQNQKEVHLFRPDLFVLKVYNILYLLYIKSSEQIVLTSFKDGLHAEQFSVQDTNLPEPGKYQLLQEKFVAKGLSFCGLPDNKKPEENCILPEEEGS